MTRALRIYPSDAPVLVETQVGSVYDNCHGLWRGKRINILSTTHPMGPARSAGARDGRGLRPRSRKRGVGLVMAGQAIRETSRAQANTEAREQALHGSGAM